MIIFDAFFKIYKIICHINYMFQEHINRFSFYKMNFFKNLWEITDRRRGQMKKQETIDIYLQKNLTSCPETLIQFFLQERQDHRQEFSNSSNKSMLEQLDHGFVLLDRWEQKYTHLEQILQRPDPCSQIQDFLEKLKDPA